MSSPITINYPAASRAYERSDLSSSPSSPGLYVPIHRRAPRAPGSGSGSGADLLGLGTPSSYTSTSSRSVSPAPSSMRSISPVPHTTMTIAHSASTSTASPRVYTPADLLRLSSSPLSKLSPERRDALRAIAPEVMWSRKQRKAQEWRTRHPQEQGQAGSHKRTASHASSFYSSEEDEERGVSWRRV